MTGTVGVLRRYPVKSMLGEELATSRVTERGLDGDRTHAVVDADTGRVATAKNPRLWRRLLACGASNGHVRLPDGAGYDRTDPALDTVLSELLGRAVAVRSQREPGASIDRSVPEEVLDLGVDAEVTVELLELGMGSPAGTFVDYAPLHLITSATLEHVASLAGAPVEALRYRPNLVLDTPELDGFAENGWVGSEVHIGTEVVLRVVLNTPRCSVPTLEHGALSRSPWALRAAMENRLDVEGFGVLPCAGVYAQVLTPGTVNAGDAVRVLPSPNGTFART